MPARLIFLGVRGSYPLSLRKGTRFGGNTASILFTTDKSVIIADAGTGIIRAKRYLPASINKITILLTHLHLDHIIGLPFFQPFYDSSYRIDIFAPAEDEESLKKIILSIFNSPFSPITSKNIKAEVTFHHLSAGMTKNLDQCVSDISIGYIHHDGHPREGVMIFRFLIGEKKIIYATDIESPLGFDQETIDFISDAYILIHDSQYLQSDYFNQAFSKKGFGHSTVEMAVKNAQLSRAQRLFLFHYDPEYNDLLLRRMLVAARKKFRRTFLAEEDKIYKI